MSTTFMNFYKRRLTQTVTYWYRTAVDAWGDSTWSRTTMSGRWEDRTDRFIRDTGEETVSNAVVYLASGVKSDGWLYEGTSVEGSPEGVSGAYPIRRVDDIPHLRGGEGIIKAFL